MVYKDATAANWNLGVAVVQKVGPYIMPLATKESSFPLAGDHYSQIVGG